MRVSMRRDQPFWAGGNSFIACESFRISAAPNPGGLYYKKLSSDWFMGASMKKPLVLPPGDPLAATFAVQSIPHTPAWNPGAGGDHDPRGTEKHLRASNITAVMDEQKEPDVVSLSFDLQLGSQDLGGATADFQSNYPDLIRDYMGRFMNHFRLSKGAYLRLETEGHGADGNTAGWAVGQLVRSPSLAIRGSGFGADGLSYQVVDCGDIEDAQAMIGTAAVPPDTQHFRHPKALDFSLLPNALQTTLTQAQTDEFYSHLGDGLTIQVTNQSTWPGHPAGTPGDPARAHWAPLLNTPLFTIVAPAGCNMRGQNQMFVGRPNNADMANVVDAIPKFPITWSGPLVDGTEFSMVVPPGYAASGNVGSPEIPAGTYRGLIQNAPAPVTNKVMSNFDLIVKVPDAARYAMDHASIQGAAINFTQGRDRLLNGDFVFCTSDNPIANTIGAKVDLAIKYQSNLAAVPFGVRTNKISAILASSETDNVILRRPAKDEDRLIYTPNEFFLAFNKPIYADDSRMVKMPYNLQTDENGGFVVRWSDTDINNPSSELIISVTMLEELGLNPWFETEIDALVDETNTDMYYVQRHQLDDWSQTANQLFRWMRRTDLTNHAPDKPFHPPNNTPATGTILYDRAGTEWVFVDHNIETQKQFTALTKRIFPGIETDSDGNPYYIWRELPQSGRITNTQQVSIESFATFSEITIVIPNLPFQPMLGTSTDERILASLRMPFIYSTSNDEFGTVKTTGFEYYGDLIFNTEPSRSYLKITTDQQLYDCDCEVRLIERDGTMHVMELPYKGEFQIKLRLVQTQ